MTKDAKTQLPARKIFAFLWQVSKPYSTMRNSAIVVSILTILGGFAGPLAIAQILSIIQAGQASESSLIWNFALLYAISQIWSQIVGWRLVLYFVWKFETAMQRDTYNQIFAKLIKETMYFHANRFGGSLVSQASKLTGALERFWDTLMWSILPLAISLIGSIVILFTLMWQYALFLAIFSIIFMVVVYFGSRPMAKLSEYEAESSNKISGKLADVVSNILAVKSAGNEPLEQSQFNKITNEWRESSLNVMRGFLKVTTVYSSINSTISIGAVIFAVIAAQNNAISVASIYLIVTYTTIVARELWSMNGIMRHTTNVIGNSQEMVKILSNDTSLKNRSNKTILVNDGRINIDNITFTHDEGAGDTLFKNFSLTINPGEKIGLVGASGSGKTTLTKLLLRFADVDSGKIEFDGQNIANVTQSSLRKSIAYVPQEPALFHRSIKENIAYSKPDATNDEIEKAAKRAGAYKFINKLADGFDTTVGERGVKLSGGQRQRIAIARAILKDAPILILDEATSALDSESEAIIQKSLETLMKGRTSIVVAHRLSTIAKLDRIIVMDNGKIIEDGTHDDLIAKKRGVYARLWKRQSGGFIE